MQSMHREAERSGPWRSRWPAASPAFRCVGCRLVSIGLAVVWSMAAQTPVGRGDPRRDDAVAPAGPVVGADFARLADAVGYLAAGGAGDVEAVLPPGTTLDRWAWVEQRANIDMTLPAGSDIGLLTALNVEHVYDVLAAVVDPQRLTGGLVIRARIGPEGEYIPLEAFAAPEHSAFARAAEAREQSAPAPPMPAPADGRTTESLAGPVAGAGTQPAGALSGVIVYCSAGHGWTAGSSYWYLQRGLLLDMVEDYGNIDQLNYFVHYLFNAGATVVPFRPVGYRHTEIVLDNDDTGVTYTGVWNNSTATTEYYENRATLSGVPYRWANAAASESATARYTPTIPETGFWPVYCWTRDGTDRVRQTYRIRHSGGVSSVVIDHRMVGKGWIWLGNYHLTAGTGNYAEITNVSPDAGVVIADAIRFGNGMGDVVRPGPGTASGYPRDEECSRYWAESELGNNAVGFSSTIWDGSGDDGSDNVGTAARWAAAMNRETYNDDRWRSIYIEFHTNAAGCSPAPCSAKGTICLVSSSAPTTYQTEYATILGDKVEADMRLIQSQFEYPWGLRSNPYAGGYGAISTYNNDNEFDATIIEVAFHDNVEDAANLLNPKVRNAVARSTLQGMIKFLNSLPGSTVPLAYPPEAPENVRAVHNGAGGVIVSWNAPPSGGANGHAATGYRIYRSSNGYGFDAGTPVGNVLSATLTDIPAGTTTYLRVAATNAGGESMPSETLAVRLPAGGPTEVLIVNGFDRVDRAGCPTQTIPAGTMKRPIVWRMNTFDYLVQHGEAIAAAGRSFDTASNEAIANGSVALSGYKAVVWICGEESTADSTFTSTEQSIVTTYLNGGGSLFVSGSEIAWELDNQNRGRSFYRDVLRAVYAADDANTYQATGATGGILADVSVFSFDPAGGAPYAADAPDALTAGTGAAIALDYVGGAGTGAAVQYDSGVYKTVVFGFPFECITSSAVRSAIMTRVLDFLIVPPPEACATRMVADFEGFADGATGVLFRNPRYSGSTLEHLASTPDVGQVTSEVSAYDGSKSFKVQWSFVDADPRRWLRLTTSDVAQSPNPTIWLDQRLRVRLRFEAPAGASLRVALGVRETNTYAPIGTDGGTAGTIEWVGADSVVSGAPQGVVLSAQPGVWQRIVFRPKTMPVTAMTGDGVLTGRYGKGVLEHLAFASTGSTGPFTVYIDSVEQLCGVAPGDFDEDGDVDLADFSVFRMCFGGPNQPLPYPECGPVDLDGDADADLTDFALFQSCFNGPNRTATCE